MEIYSTTYYVGFWTFCSKSLRIRNSFTSMAYSPILEFALQIYAACFVHESIHHRIESGELLLIFILKLNILI